MATSSLAAAAYSEVSEQIRRRGETFVCAIFEAARSALALPEEECGAEIMAAMATQIRAGLIACNTHDPVRNAIVIGAGTLLASIPHQVH